MKPLELEDYIVTGEIVVKDILYSNSTASIGEVTDEIPVDPTLSLETLPDNATNRLGKG